MIPQCRSGTVRTVLAVTLLVSSFSLSVASLETVLSSGAEECFVVRSSEPATISGDYDCLDDELPPDPLSVLLTDGNDKVLWSSTPGASEGNFNIHAKDGGRFTLCLRNGMGSQDGADGQDRLVGFALRVRPPSRALDESLAGPDQERALRLVEWASGLTEEWDNLLDHYDYLRTREAVHKQLSETMLRRVVRWTVLEALLLVLIASAQVLYFRKFFEKRRYL